MNYTSVFIDKLRNGDRKSYETLFYDLFPSLVLYANKYVHDDALSEDIVQEVFIVLWNNSSKINVHTSIKSYLYASVKNLAINKLDKKKTENKRKDKYLSTEFVESENFDEIKFEDDEKLLSQNVYYYVHKAIESLPKKSRDVILMSMQDMSIEDIQNKLNVSKNTVKTHKRRAYAMLRDKLKNNFHFLMFFFTP